MGDGFRTCNIDAEYRFRGRQKKFGPIYGRRSLIYEVLKMKNTLHFTFVVILVFVTSSLALNCKCNKKACPRLECPEAEQEWGRCRCCKRCLGKIGENCGGPLNMNGKCSSGLHCTPTGYIPRHAKNLQFFGICCKPQCRMHCEHGFERDAMNCPKCKCRQCSLKQCRKRCEHGFAEKDGCKICKCKAGPEVAAGL